MNMLGSLDATALTSAIGGATTTAEGLIVAGFAVTVVFMVARIIKKGASRVG